MAIYNDEPDVDIEVNGKVVEEIMAPEHFELTKDNVLDEWNGKLMDFITAGLELGDIPIEDTFCEYVNCNSFKDIVARMIREEQPILAFVRDGEFLFVLNEVGKEVRC